MNLVIDIGNTRAKLTAFDGWEAKAHITTSLHLTDISTFISKHGCRKGILSSTVALNDSLELELASLPIPIMRLTWQTPVPIQNRYRTPQTLGTDRLAAVVGAWAMAPKHNSLVIDVGTCVTYDFLDAEGNYWGGNISPGLTMRLQAMHQMTSRLPLIAAEGDLPTVGYDTETALRSGATEGLRHEVEGYIRQFRQKYPDIFIFLTGGNAINLEKSKESCIFVPENNVLTDERLVAKGLNYILEYNT